MKQSRLYAYIYKQKIVHIHEGRITRKNLVHFCKNLKQKSYRKIQRSFKNPKNL